MSKLDGHWSDEEDRRLHELPHGAQVLYLRGMRRFVQRDGTCGRAPRKLSERMFIELLTVPAVSGRHAAKVVTPTRKTVRHLLAMLAESGLVVQLPVSLGRFVFRLPHSLQDESVLRRKGPMKGSRTEPIASSQTTDLADCRHPNAPMMGPRMASRKGPPQSKASQVHTSTSAYRSTSRASEIGALCRELREIGMLDAHPGRVELVEALSSGIDPGTVVSTARELAQRRMPNVGYLIATVRGRLLDAALEPRRAFSRGHRLSVCDAIQEQAAQFSDRERSTGLHVIKGGRD